jgi:hypothetical protein
VAGASELPSSWRPFLYWTAVLYSVVAAAINMPHVLDHLGQHGIHDGTRWFYMITPDALLFVGLILAKYLRRHPLGWTMLALGVSWLVWAGLSDAQATGSARLLAVAPVAVGVLFALAVDQTKGDVAEPAVVTGSVRVEAEPVVTVPEAFVEAPTMPSTKAPRAAVKAVTKGASEGRAARARARYEAFVAVVEADPTKGPKELHLMTGEPPGTIERWLRQYRNEKKEGAA